MDQINNVFDFYVTDEYEGIRIDKLISELIDSLSRTYIKKLIDDKKVFCNDKNVKASFSVSEGDHIVMEIPPVEVPEIVPQDIPLDILYEDKDVLVVNKPKGMVVHPAPGHYTGTLVNALMFHCGDELSGINGIMRPGIVHRIDMDTTGSLLVCKNDKAHLKIAEQLKEHSLTRIYTALTHGVIRDDEGTVNTPIGRSEKDRKKMSVNYRNGKPAVTNYRVIRRFENFSLVECRLETGRTHQIRVHLSSIGYPVVGDELYCPYKPPCSLQGQTLHAGVIGFIHPTTGEYMEFSAPLPEYFEMLIKRIS
jgi:23S rRNA pseudouridine1911/1915/1917 synthase